VLKIGNVEISGWHHLALPVPDLDRSLAWYERVLGAVVLRRTDVDPRDLASGRNRQVWLKIGPTTLNLAESDPVHRRFEQHFLHFALTAEPGSLDAWIAHLNQQSVQVLGPYGHGGLPIVSLYFDDPDGYRWELVIGYPDFEAAKAAAQAHGGRLGHPSASYDW
jgi:catechol 2,3-dioxygenase-like lactoylglutathione lyase family enzyme